MLYFSSSFMYTSTEKNNNKKSRFSIERIVALLVNGSNVCDVRVFDWLHIFANFFFFLVGMKNSPQKCTIDWFIIIVKSQIHSMVKSVRINFPSKLYLFSLNQWKQTTILCVLYTTSILNQ